MMPVTRSRLEAGNRPRNEVIQLSKPVNIKPKSIHESEVCLFVCMFIVCVCVCSFWHILCLCIYCFCQSVMAKFWLFMIYWGHVDLLGKWFIIFLMLCFEICQAALSVDYTEKKIALYVKFHLFVWSPSNGFSWDFWLMDIVNCGILIVIDFGVFLFMEYKFAILPHFIF